MSLVGVLSRSSCYVMQCSTYDINYALYYRCRVLIALFSIDIYYAIQALYVYLYVYYTYLVLCGVQLTCCPQSCLLWRKVIYFHSKLLPFLCWVKETRAGEIRVYIWMGKKAVRQNETWNRFKRNNHLNHHG